MVSSTGKAEKVALDRRVEAVKVMMEVSVEAAGVVEATARATIDLTVSANRSSTSLARPHPVLALDPLQDMELLLAPTRSVS